MEEMEGQVMEEMEGQVMEEQLFEDKVTDDSNVNERNTGVPLKLGDLMNIYKHRFRLTEVWLEYAKPPTAYLTHIVEELTKG